MFWVPLGPMGPNGTHKIYHNHKSNSGIQMYYPPFFYMYTKVFSIVLVQLGQLPKYAVVVLVWFFHLVYSVSMVYMRAVVLIPATLTVELSVVNAIGESRYFKYVHSTTCSVLHETLRYNGRLQNFFYLSSTGVLMYW